MDNLTIRNTASDLATLNAEDIARANYDVLRRQTKRPHLSNQPEILENARCPQLPLTYCSK